MTTPSGSPWAESAVPSIDERKLVIREEVWKRLEARGAVDGPVRGKIPDFHGAHQAALRLARLEEWSSAGVVKAMPDRPQQPVRQLALREGKILYMATPKLATDQPFVILDPRELGDRIEQIVSSQSAVTLGRGTDVSSLEPIDLIVCGAVAVTADGPRLGKGAGYADIEVALLTAAGLVGPNTLIATTVHDLQVVDHGIPEQGHDFSVDLIITPTRVIRSSRRRRPAGINWSEMPLDKIAAIPALARRAEQRS